MSTFNAIHEAIEAYDANRKVLSDKEKVELALDLNRFVIDAIAKYYRGQKEHGGHISDRDLNIEIDNELIDLFFYHQANKRKVK